MFKFNISENIKFEYFIFNTVPNIILNTVQTFHLKAA